MEMRRQIDDRDDEDPNEIDEVPIDRRVLHGDVTLGAEVTREGSREYEQQQRKAHRNMGEVQRRDGVEDRAVRIVIGPELLQVPPVLEDLDDEVKIASKMSASVYGGSSSSGHSGFDVPK